MSNEKRSGHFFNPAKMPLPRNELLSWNYFNDNDENKPVVNLAPTSLGERPLYMCHYCPIITKNRFTASSPANFNCVGCRKMTYCSEECVVRNYTRHLPCCLKRCAFCGLGGATFVCVNCEEYNITYCSYTCMRNDDDRHFPYCKGNVDPKAVSVEPVCERPQVNLIDTPVDSRYNFKKLCFAGVYAPSQYFEWIPAKPQGAKRTLHFCNYHTRSPSLSRYY